MARLSDTVWYDDLILGFYNNMHCDVEMTGGHRLSHDDRGLLRSLQGSFSNAIMNHAGFESYCVASGCLSVIDKDAKLRNC